MVASGSVRAAVGVQKGGASLTSYCSISEAFILLLREDEAGESAETRQMGAGQGAQGRALKPKGFALQGSCKSRSLAYSLIKHNSIIIKNSTREAQRGLLAQRLGANYSASLFVLLTLGSSVSVLRLSSSCSSSFFTSTFSSFPSSAFRFFALPPPPPSPTAPKGVFSLLWRADPKAEASSFSRVEAREAEAEASAWQVAW